VVNLIYSLPSCSSTLASPRLLYLTNIITCRYSGTPLIRTQVIRIANYPDRLGPSGKFVDNCTKLTCLQITGYRIKYSTVLWLLELQIRQGRKVETQVHTVNSNSQTSNCQFSKKNPIIRIFSISGWLAVPINLSNWSSAVLATSCVFRSVSCLVMYPSSEYLLSKTVVGTAFQVFT